MSVEGISHDGVRTIHYRERQQSPLRIRVIVLLHHVSAPAGCGADESLVPELVDGLADGDGCQAELLLQRTLAGQAAGDLPGGDPGSQDGRELHPRRIWRV